MKTLIDRAGWLLTVVAVFIVLAPSLLYPPDRDQAIFSRVASAINEGRAPYRDVFDLKPPGIHLAYAGVMSIAEWLRLPWLPSLRVADVLVAAVASLLILGLARRLGRPELGLPAATWYAALYLSTQYWGMAQAESWSIPFLLAAMLCCLIVACPLSPCSAESKPNEAKLSVNEKEAHSLLMLALVGGFAGIVAVFKFPAVLPLFPFLCLAMGEVWKEQGRKATLLHGTVATLCGMIPFFVCYLWLRQIGAWNDYVDVQNNLVVPYASLNQLGQRSSLLNPLDWTPRLGDFVGYFAGWMAVVWFPFTLAMAGVIVGRSWRYSSERVALLAFGCGVLAVGLQNKYLYYHWQPALPLLALLCAIGVAQPLRQTRLPPATIPLIGALVALLWSLALQWSIYRDAALYATGQISEEKWLARFNANGRFSYWNDTVVAAYIRDTTRREDPIFMWGYQPTIYLLAQRPVPTRFFFNQPVTAPFAPRRWRDELLHDLQRHPPTLVIVTKNDFLPWTNGLTTDSATQLRSWPALYQWLTRYYRFETTIADFMIYRRIISASSLKHLSERLSWE